MKNLVFIAIVLSLGFTACGQKVKKEDVPSSVITKFTLAYPKVENVKWSKEHGKYEAEFKLKDVETSVLYDSLGTLIETESEIAVKDLPAAVNDYVKQKYNDAKIKEASKMTDARGVVTYEAEVKGTDLIFDAQGKFIQNKKENAAVEKEVVVPATVKAKFASLYPKVTEVKWGFEDKNYEAEFDVNKVETSATFNAAGNLLETETEIAVSELPKPVLAYFTKTVMGETIKEAAKITDAKGVVTYEAEVKGVDYLFDKDGNFIKKEAEDKD